MKVDLAEVDVLSFVVFVLLLVRVDHPKSVGEFLPRLFGERTQNRSHVGFNIAIVDDCDDCDLHECLDLIRTRWFSARVSRLGRGLFASAEPARRPTRQVPVPPAGTQRAGELPTLYAFMTLSTRMLSTRATMASFVAPFPMAASSGARRSCMQRSSGEAVLSAPCHTASTKLSISGGTAYLPAALLRAMRSLMRSFQRRFSSSATDVAMTVRATYALSDRFMSVHTMKPCWSTVSVICFPFRREYIEAQRIPPPASSYM